MNILMIQMINPAVVNAALLFFVVAVVPVQKGKDFIKRVGEII